MDFNKNQDLKIKGGVRMDNGMLSSSAGARGKNGGGGEVPRPVAYFKVRENNMHFSIDSDRKWMVRYDL